MSIINNCIICLEEGKLIEYNHCGNYLVHQKCLNKWKSTECFICRKNLIENLDIESESSQTSEQTNDIQIIYQNSRIRNRGNIFITIGCLIFITIGCLILISYFIFTCTKVIHIKKHHGQYEINIY